MLLTNQRILEGGTVQVGAIKRRALLQIRKTPELQHLQLRSQRALPFRRH